MNFHEACDHIGISLATGYVIGKGNYSYEVRKMISLITELGGKLILTSKELGERETNTLDDMVQYFKDLAGKNRLAIEKIANEHSISYSSLFNQLDVQPTIKIEEWLHICDAFEITMTFVAPQKNEDKEDIPGPILNMTRDDFVGLIAKAKKESQMSSRELSSTLKKQPTTIIRLEKGIHNFKMELVIDYLTAIKHHLTITYHQASYTIQKYEDLPHIISDIQKQEKWTIKDMAKRSGLSTFSVIEGFFNLSHIISIDSLLKICNTFGITINIVKDPDQDLFLIL